MLLLDVDWHPYWSYEWWRDIGASSAGAIASTLVGGAAVWIAIRSHRVADEANKRDRDRTARAERQMYGDRLNSWVTDRHDLMVDRVIEWETSMNSGAGDAWDQIVAAAVTLDDSAVFKLNASIYRALRVQDRPTMLFADDPQWLEQMNEYIGIVEDGVRRARSWIALWVRDPALFIDMYDAFGEASATANASR